LKLSDRGRKRNMTFQMKITFKASLQRHHELPVLQWSAYDEDYLDKVIKASKVSFDE
jgi:hypothetical protein